MDADDGLLINKTRVAPGARVTIDLRVARLYTHSEITMPVHVVHGRQPGPRLFVSAAIHGDEINGVEIIRRLLRLPLLKRISGVLLAVPIVNVHGFIHHSRYLPDRRDLNRSFPGSADGSLPARLAHQIMTEVMRTVGMLPAETAARRRAAPPMVARASSWVRAPESGIFRTVRRLGDPARKGDLLGVVADPFGERDTDVVAPCNGMIISRMNLPLVNAGDALFHIARFDRAGKTAREEVLQKEDQFDESRPDEADEML